MSQMTVTDKETKQVKQSGKEKKSKANEQKAPSEGLIAYLKGVRSEWTKVSWPTWPQIWGQTIVVLITVAIATAGLWALDNVFRILIDLIT